jgi:hypothetical protein
MAERKEQPMVTLGFDDGSRKSFTRTAAIGEKFKPTCIGFGPGKAQAALDRAMADLLARESG